MPGYLDIQAFTPTILCYACLRDFGVPLPSISVITPKSLPWCAQCGNAILKAVMFIEVPDGSIIKCMEDADPPVMYPNCQHGVLGTHKAPFDPWVNIERAERFFIGEEITSALRLKSTFGTPIAKAIVERGWTFIETSVWNRLQLPDTKSPGRDKALEQLMDTETNDEVHN